MVSQIPRWEQVREFCLKQGYKEKRGDHFRYAKPLPDRTSSGTMVSHGVDGEQVPPRRWLQVWKRQLRLASEDEFWKGLRGEPVQYALAVEPEVPVDLPPYLLNFLQNTLRLQNQEVALLTKEQAQDLFNEFNSRELRCKE